MSNLNIRFSETIGKIKPMHAVNNAPVRARTTQKRENFDTFSMLKIPYARTHDASLSEIYGSQHVMDVHCIFPDFSREKANGIYLHLTPSNYLYLLIIDFLPSTFPEYPPQSAQPRRSVLHGSSSPYSNSH